MTASASLPIAPPSLKRFWPKALLLTIAVHALALAAFMLAPPADGGGGGKVIGRLSVSLGNAASNGAEAEATPEAEPSTRKPAEAEPEAEPAPPTPTNQVAPEPVPAEKPARTHPQRKPVKSATPPDLLPRADTAATSAAGTAGTPSAGAQSVGEGAPSQNPGLGTTEKKSGDAFDAYFALVRQSIERHRFYPGAARRRREEGTVAVMLRIDAAGTPHVMEILESAGSFHLDRAARRMIEKAAPFPAPPAGSFAATIPISFSIQ